MSAGIGLPKDRGAAEGLGTVGSGHAMKQGSTEYEQMTAAMYELLSLTMPVTARLSRASRHFFAAVTDTPMPAEALPHVETIRAMLVDGVDAEKVAGWTPRELEDLKEAFLGLYQIIARRYYTGAR